MAHLMTQVNRGVVVVYFRSAKVIDQMVIDAVGRELKEAMDRAEHQMLLLNFHGVTFMSSAMLGKLMSLYKECKKAKVNLKLSNITGEIMEVFRVTNLDRLLKLYPDEADAMKAFEKEGRLR